MEEYNVLVLMEKDKESGYLSETIDSYPIEAGQEGLSLVEGIYLLEEEDSHYVYLTLTTKDVEDWEYYGIYELYDEAIYDDMEVEVLDGSGEYNPRWILRYRYSEDRHCMTDLLNRLIGMHIAELGRIKPLLQENKVKYMEESAENGEEE